MQLVSGDNHLISARNGMVICQVWVREDLSPEEGARNAEQMVKYLADHALSSGTQYRGLMFDVRRAPPVFGPKTRQALFGLLESAARAGVPVAVLAGAAAIQTVQFANLCRESTAQARVFDNEGEAVLWLESKPSRPAKR